MLVKNQFGVKMGDIRNIAKKLKTNHELGLQLWNAGIVEAQFLAILIMKPDLLTAKQLDTMVQQMDFTHVADWFSSYILKDHPAKEALRIQWLKSKNKWALRAGWSLMAGKIARDADGLDLDAILKQLQKEIPQGSP